MVIQHRAQLSLRSFQLSRITGTNTNFPRVFAFDQIIAVADRLVKDTNPADWVSNLRDAAFVMGTLLTHTKAMHDKITPACAERAASMSDPELVQEIETLKDPNIQQGLLRAQVSAILAPETFAVILEICMRFISQHQQAIGICYQATAAPTEVVEVPEETTEAPVE